MEREVREVLEAAWNELHDHQKAPWQKLAVGDGMERFRRFLDAEAWTDAAMCLVPESHRIVTLTEHVDRGGWYVKLAVHSPHKALPAVEAPTLALALAQACLKARENGDG